MATESLWWLDFDWGRFRLPVPPPRDFAHLGWGYPSIIHVVLIGPEGIISPQDSRLVCWDATLVWPKPAEVAYLGIITLL